MPLWLCAALVAVLVAFRWWRFRALQRQLGAHRVAFHPSGRWLVLDPGEGSAGGWEFDLTHSPARAPLMWPGVAFLGWGLLQLVPLPPAVVHALSPGRGHLSLDEVPRAHPITIDAAATTRGLAFAASMLAFHLGAAALADLPACRRRFRLVVSWLGAALALVALAQVAVAARRIYGVFKPLESSSFFGAFVNRNHFASYMTMCAMAGFAVLHRALAGYRQRLGPRSNTSRRLLVLGKPEGVRVILAVVPVLLAIGALIASTSRGGILSFVGALVLASAGIRRHQQRLPAGVFAFLLVVLPLAWFGLDRLEQRFSRIPTDEAGRTVIWRYSVSAMSGNWLTGAGLNTFREAISLVPPLALPAGATAWPAHVAQAVPAHLRIARRAPAEPKTWQWYREAHNDYVQLVVEMGVIGAAIAAWALVALVARMREPWLSAGVAAVLVHSTVDFSLQVPAAAVLFIALAAFATRTSPIMRP